MELLSQMEFDAFAPKTEQELAAFISNTEENHFIEFKANLDKGPDSSVEIARDIAALSLSGGHLIIGIADKTKELVPVLSYGITERLDQIINSHISPKLKYRILEIPSNINDKSFFVVSVPPSPYAPHMVKNKYMARGEKSKTYLEDDSVRRLILDSSLIQNNLENSFDEIINKDPIPLSQRKSAHLHLIAAPLQIDDEVCINWIRESSLNIKFPNTLIEIEKVWKERFPSEPWFLKEYLHFSNRESGIAFTSESLWPNRESNIKADWSADYIHEFQFFENGLITFLDGDMSTSLGGRGGVLKTLGLLSLVRQQLMVIKEMAEELKYFGSWKLCIGITGLSGLQIDLGEMNFLKQPITYPNTTAIYRKTALGSFDDLENKPDSVLWKLLGSYLRTTRSENLAVNRGLIREVHPY